MNTDTYLLVGHVQPNSCHFDELIRTVRLNMIPSNTCPHAIHALGGKSYRKSAHRRGEKSRRNRTPPQDAAACVESTENWAKTTKKKKLGCHRGTQASKHTDRMCTQARIDSHEVPKSASYGDAVVAAAAAAVVSAGAAVVAGEPTRDSMLD